MKPTHLGPLLAAFVVAAASVFSPRHQSRDAARRGDRPRHRQHRRDLERAGGARARCPACGHDFLVAFSCKGRGVCPSCNTRRMAETAAHLIDHVFPQVPVRQWLLSFAKRLRYFLHRDPGLAGRVCQ